MDPQRGRSPSTGHQQSHINPSHSPSPHQFQENATSIGLGLGLDTQNQNSNTQQFQNPGFNGSNTLPSFETNDLFNQQRQSFAQNDSSFAQNQDFSQRFKQEDSQFKQEDQLSPFSQQQQPSFTQELMSATISPNFNGGDFSLFSTASNQNEQLDPQFFMDGFSPQSGNQSVNPAELDMSSPPNSAQSPPSHLQPDNSRSPHQSPNFNSGQFQPSPSHSRHASLGPESAAFPQGHNNIEWSMIGAPQFQGHRRTPSEYSDISNSSAAPSPNLPLHDTFEPIDPLNHHSPMHNAQNDGMYQDVMAIGNFSLSDHGTPGRGLSPAHSPAISPRLGPQQLPNVNQQSQFMLGVNNGFGHPQSIYGSRDSDYPQINHNGSLDMGQAQQMVPPEINVEFAPTSRTNSFEPPKPGSFDNDALTPPDRGTCPDIH